MSALTDRLAEWIIQDNAILFVGGGLRRAESGLSAIEELVEALAERIDYQRPDRSLASVARDFEVLKGRQELVATMREELERSSGQVTELDQLIAEAILPYTKVITTRFDQILERALDQYRKEYVLIVRDTDVPFFDESKITLIKMVGDIGQPESLVVTEDDIDAFLQKLPTISDVIRAFFATKTLIFLGYDLNSELFKRIYRQVLRNLSAFQRPAYAIVPDPLDPVDASYWKGQNVTIHEQDPIQFLEQLAQAVKARTQALEALPVAPTETRARPPLPEKPYKGLASFTYADSPIFAGRGEEARRLANRILARRVTVLYGESGSGKTSLLHAGAGPLLADQRALLAAFTPAADQDLLAGLQSALQAHAAQAGLAAEEGMEPAGQIRGWQRELGGPLVLAVDDFEQFLLAVGDNGQQASLDELRHLVSDRSLDLRLVLVVREDFLAPLSSLESEWPGLLAGRFRLERLGREAARAAIEEPSRPFGIGWEPDLVDRILDVLHEERRGGVAPTQLQLVCERLYEAVTSAPATDDAGMITLAAYEELGGVGAILGEHLDKAVGQFQPEAQPLVRALLGALVSSAGVKQRLDLLQLSRAVEADSEQALEVLERLHMLRLVVRYPGNPQAEPPQPDAYELAHEALIPGIAGWLGDDFWAAQRAREVMRQALPAWRREARLLAAEDLELVAGQLGLIKLSDDERNLGYASAIARSGVPGDWETLVPAPSQDRVLLQLTGNSDPGVRARASGALGGRSAGDVAETLARLAVADPSSEVRHAAAVAISGPDLNVRAVELLASAAGEPDSGISALRALARVRDHQPLTEAALPGELRAPLRRRVWARRWRRHQARIWAAALQGLQAGFWGLALGLGVFLGLWNASLSLGPNNPVRLYFGVLLLGMSLVGLLGALAVGGANFLRVVMQSLQDRPRPRRDWLLIAGLSAVLFSLGLVMVGAASAGTPRPAETALAGLLIGLAVAGTATLPSRLPWAVRLLGSALAGAASFVLVGYLDLFFNRSFGWLVAMGLACGIGFSLGFWSGTGAEPSSEGAEAD